MKIREIRAVGLHGKTPEGGWTNELRPDECVNTLVTVQTDEGLTGLGSVYTNDDLVRGALAVMRPLWEGENALEPERVEITLDTALVGPGRSVFDRARNLVERDAEALFPLDHVTRIEVQSMSTGPGRYSFLAAVRSEGNRTTYVVLNADKARVAQTAEAIVTSPAPA